MSLTSPQSRVPGRRLGRAVQRAAYAVVEPPRAILEASALAATLPVLVSRRPPEPHSVLVVPGLSGGSAWAAALRAFLGMLGHSVHTPHLGATKGGPDWVRERIAAQVDDIARASGSRVSLVGWSVGGCATREVALVRPDLVRQVVTLGTPLTPRWFSRGHQAARGRLPVPSTALYSRSDGVFSWRSCVQDEAARSENVEILSSHLGMASNPAAYHAVADRLSLPEGHWESYASTSFPF